jgi:hypothetical protein
MTLRIPTTNADGMMPAPFASMIQQLNAIGQVASGSALQTGNNVLDQYQNTVVVIGSLNQTVTVGAGFFTTTGTLSTSSLVVPVASTVGLEKGMRVNGTGIVLNTTIVSIVVGTSITLSRLPTAGGSGVTLTIGPGGGVQTSTALSGFGIASQANLAATTIATTAGSPYATVASATGFVDGYSIGAADANTGAEVVRPGTTYTLVGSGPNLTLTSNALLTETAAYCCSNAWLALTPGAWVPLTLGSGISTLTGGPTPAARFDVGGSVRLRGQLYNGSGSSIVAGTALATIPSTVPTQYSAGYSYTMLYPVVYGNPVGVGFLSISAAGQFELSATLPNTGVVALDGITYTVN